MIFAMHQEKWKGVAYNGMKITPSVVLANAQFWLEDKSVDDLGTLSHLYDHAMWQIDKYREDLVHVAWALGEIGQAFERTTPLPKSFKRSWFRYRQQNKTPQECFHLLERITTIRIELNKIACDALAQKKQKLAIAL